MTLNEQPVYEHDCRACIFLGRGKASRWTDDKAPDFYFCPSDMAGPTLVARYGTEGTYRSSDISMVQRAVEIEKPDHYVDYPLAEALKIAYDRGLVKETLIERYLREGNELLANPAPGKDALLYLSGDLGRAGQVSEAAKELGDKLFERWHKVLEAEVEAERSGPQVRQTSQGLKL